jgi:hypothetical protein
VVGIPKDEHGYNNTPYRPIYYFFAVEKKEFLSQPFFITNFARKRYETTVRHNICFRDERRSDKKRKRKENSDFFY